MMKLLLMSFLWLVTTVVTANQQDKDQDNTNKVTFFTLSQSYSNILPVKQLLKDDWKNAPKNSASKGFTQNEIGVRSYWKNFSFSLSQRYDYFVNSNLDTAKAFYLERKGLPLDTQENYQLDLQLYHQRSNGLRLGYKFVFDNFSSEVRLGYWQLKSTRESHLSGQLSGDNQGNINGTASLSEYYSHNNFLRRENDNDWNIDGSGTTVDVLMNWQATSTIKLSAALLDVYSDFSTDNSGYSEGRVNTEGTFINSVGGIAYLPLYRGIERSKKHNFDLPKHIELQASYKGDVLEYFVNYKKQAEVDFYYVGVEMSDDETSIQLLFDIENLAPEIHYRNNWLSLIFSIDDINLEKAMLLNLGLSVNYNF